MCFHLWRMAIPAYCRAITPKVGHVIAHISGGELFIYQVDGHCQKLLPNQCSNFVRHSIDLSFRIGVEGPVNLDIVNGHVLLHTIEAQLQFSLQSGELREYRQLETNCARIRNWFRCRTVDWIAEGDPENMRIAAPVDTRIAFVSGSNLHIGECSPEAFDPTHLPEMDLTIDVERYLSDAPRYLAISGNGLVAFSCGRKILIVDPASGIRVHRLSSLGGVSSLWFESTDLVRAINMEGQVMEQFSADEGRFYGFPSNAFRVSMPTAD